MKFTFLQHNLSALKFVNLKNIVNGELVVTVIGFSRIAKFHAFALPGMSLSCTASQMRQYMTDSQYNAHVWTEHWKLMDATLPSQGVHGVNQPLSSIMRHIRKIHRDL